MEFFLCCTGLPIETVGCVFLFRIDLCMYLCGLARELGIRAGILLLKFLGLGLTLVLCCFNVLSCFYNSNY